MIPDLSSEGVRLEAAGKKHARELARLVRAPDKAEGLSQGIMPEQAVRMSVNMSLESWAAYRGRDLLAVFGYGPMRNAPMVTVAWALTTVNVDKYPLTYWRCSKKIVNRLRDEHQILCNMVHADYWQARRWLERLGFKVSEPEPFGPHGSPHCKAILYTPKILTGVA